MTLLTCDCIFDQINAATVSIKYLVQKYFKNLTRHKLLNCCVYKPLNLETDLNINKSDINRKPGFRRSI